MKINKNKKISNAFGIINNPGSTSLEKAMARTSLSINLDDIRLENSDTFYFYDENCRYNYEHIDLLQLIALKKFSTNATTNYVLYFLIKSSPLKSVWILASSISLRDKGFLSFLRKIQKNSEQLIIFKNALRVLNLAKRRSLSLFVNQLN